MNAEQARQIANRALRQKMDNATAIPRYTQAKAAIEREAAAGNRFTTVSTSSWFKFIDAALLQKVLEEEGYTIHRSLRGEYLAIHW